MRLQPDEKRKLLKRARRNRISGWDAGCLALQHFFHLKDTGKPFFTEKQLKVFDNAFTAPASDLKQQEVYVRLARDLPVTIGTLMNEAKAHTFLLESYFNQAIAVLLAQAYDHPHKKLLPDLKNLSVLLKQQIPAIWGALLAYEQIMRRLMLILGFEYREPAELVLMVKEIYNKFQLFLAHCQQHHPKMRRALTKLAPPHSTEGVVRLEVLDMLRRRIHLPSPAADREVSPWWELPPYCYPLQEQAAKIPAPRHG